MCGCIAGDQMLATVTNPTAPELSQMWETSQEQEVKKQRHFSMRSQEQEVDYLEKDDHVYM